MKLPSGTNQLGNPTFALKSGVASPGVRGGSRTYQFGTVLAKSRDLRKRLYRVPK